MTPGQGRALRELRRLEDAAPGSFEVTGQYQELNGKLSVPISIRLGPMEAKPGGLDLREREDFILLVPPDFPFDFPTLIITDKRFAGFPHVVWSTWICLYQTALEWNPADGLYGFFDRLKDWLAKAALGELDPVGGPLDPPHYVYDSSKLPFVVRANVPVAAGKEWIGFAELQTYSNRVELVGWSDLATGWAQGRTPALAVFLPQPLPIDFPKLGGDLLRELMKQGVDRHRFLSFLAAASVLTRKGEPVYLVVGVPMRRAPDGAPAVHIAVWATDELFADSARLALGEPTDGVELRRLTEEFADKLFAFFEREAISWCRVLEDRDEIVVRRDATSAGAWFAGKKILVVGCGALGSWAAEMIARTRPQLMHLVDNDIVKPGLLARQDYELNDLASNKAEALADRLRAVVMGPTIHGYRREAHAFVTEDPARFRSYDVVLDCTASNVFQMKLERDWPTLGDDTPCVISMVVDAKAKRCLCVVTPRKSRGGVWHAYVGLKWRLCLEPGSRDIVSAFYSDSAAKELFQPEPGCSDLTFSGSTPDVCTLVSTALNLALASVESAAPVGIAFSAQSPSRVAGPVNHVSLPAFEEAGVGEYRVRIASNVLREARAWIRQNSRLRSRQHETGGLLWGLWDDAVGVIWVLDSSGPPPDSQHDPGHFVCGIEGTLEEYRRRFELSHGACGFIGMWHTHPDMLSIQSLTDMSGMAGLVSRLGENTRRALMVIFGRQGTQPSAGLYVYESAGGRGPFEAITVAEAQIQLREPLV